MAYLEFDINDNYRLFGDFYHVALDGKNSNPFWATHRTVLNALPSPPSQLVRFNRLDTDGIFATDSNGNKFTPIGFNLVIPNGNGTTPYPLAVFIHGQSLTYYTTPDGPTRAREVASYRGYRYLQYYLADRGVASVSVNVNVVSYFAQHSSTFELFERIQLAQLALVTLKQLSDSPITTNQPIMQKRTAGLEELQTVLASTDTFAASSPEGRLKSLRTALTGKLSFTSLGFMGHSRGAAAVQLLQPIFVPRTATAPSGRGTGDENATPLQLAVGNGIYNSNTRINTAAVPIHDFLYHRMMDFAGQYGSPGLDALKTVVSLQPHQYEGILDSPTTFFLSVASSHDTDVEESSFNAYENVNCPKAMFFSHGATHERFNMIWRRMPDIRDKINSGLLCQSPIRILSNRGHENLANAVIGNTFLAGLLAQNHRYRFYTGELRATSIGQDIERAWKFPFPFASPPALRVLDGAAVRATNLTTGTALTLPEPEDPSSTIVGANFTGEVKTVRIDCPAHNDVVIRIAIAAADMLAQRTHFSMRYAKAYNAPNASVRRSFPLKNYTLRLKENGTRIGNEIPGSAVPSLHHPAYPVRQNDGEFGPECNDDTTILLQTAEVPLAQFITGSTQTMGHLAQVDTIEIQLQNVSGAAAEEWFFVDFLLTTRDLPATPAGFEIP
jgi:hypothetical protein